MVATRKKTFQNKRGTKVASREWLGDAAKQTGSLIEESHVHNIYRRVRVVTKKAICHI